MRTEVLAQPVDNILAIYNPMSAEPGTVERHRDNLVEYGESYGFRVNAVESVAGLSGTISLLAANVDHHTRIVIISGDGGVHNAANAHEALSLNNGIATLGTGGAGDIDRSLNPTEWHSRNPHSVLTSPLVGHRPLSITAEHGSIPNDDQRRKLQAVAYFSIGFTAEMAKRFNQPDFRSILEDKAPQHRLLLQGREVLTSIGNYDKPFTVYSADSQRVVNEVVYPNGSRMAKVNRFRGLDLLEPGYGRLRTKRIDMLRVPLTAGRAAIGLFTKFDPEHIERFTVETRDEADITVQADGETYDYPSGTRFSVGLSNGVLPLATSRSKFLPEIDLTSL